MSLNEFIFSPLFPIILQEIHNMKYVCCFTKYIWPHDNVLHIWLLKSLQGLCNLCKLNWVSYFILILH